MRVPCPSPAVLLCLVSKRVMHRLVLILVVTGFAAGCATRRPAPAPAAVAPPPLVDVLPLLSRGCYRCFEEAFDLASKQKQPALALEAALLAALRSKELGMPHEAWMARAREVALPGPASASLIEMVDAVSPDPLAGDRELLTANPKERSRYGALLPEWRARLAAGTESPEFRLYVEKAVVCDLCASTNLGREACVYACPHDAAMRVNGMQFSFEPR